MNGDPSDFRVPKPKRGLGRGVSRPRFDVRLVPIDEGICFVLIAWIPANTVWPVGNDTSRRKPFIINGFRAVKVDRGLFASVDFTLVRRTTVRARRIREEIALKTVVRLAHVS